MTNETLWDNPQAAVDPVAESRASILEEARKTINGERQDSYGNPEDSFADIALLWGWYLGRTLRPSDVAMLMALLKFSRERHQHKRDNVVDACGYLSLYSYLQSC